MGTIFSLIVVYFIFLYSKDKGWIFLAFISKWYLIITGILIAIPIIVILLVMMFSLLLLLIAYLKTMPLRKKYKTKGYIDAEYKVKE